MPWPEGWVGGGLQISILVMLALLVPRSKLKYSLTESVSRRPVKLTMQVGIARLQLEESSKR